MIDDREELFKLWSLYGSSFESDSSEGYELADAILASDWLAARDAEIRDAALKEAEDTITAIRERVKAEYGDYHSYAPEFEGLNDALEAIAALRIEIPPKLG
jgi:hypothetical protein